jgi:hypothetical protein
LRVGGAAAAQRNRVDEFYLLSRNSQRNEENRLLRMVVHTYGGALHLQALTANDAAPIAGIPEARFMNVCDGSVRPKENLT